MFSLKYTLCIGSKPRNPLRWDKQKHHSIFFPFLVTYVLAISSQASLIYLHRKMSAFLCCKHTVKSSLRESSCLIICRETTVCLFSFGKHQVSAS